MQSFHIQAWSTEIHDSKKGAERSAQAFKDNGHLVEPIKSLDDNTGRFYFVYRNIPGYWNGQGVKDGKLVTRH